MNPQVLPNREPALDLPPPTLLDARGQPHLGRFRAPIADPALPGPRWRRKEWQYVSLRTSECFVAFAVVQLGYVANLFCYLVDLRQDPPRMLQTEALSPLGRGLTFAPSSVQGTTVWQRGSDRLEIRGDPHGWHVALDVGLQGERLVADLSLQAEEALALVHPLAPGRVAYTHKAAGLPAHGSVTWRGETLDARGLATVDWTRSQALRTTVWKWASLVQDLPDGRRLGLNVSAQVYDGPDGASRENAVWLDGRVIPLSIARFHLPRDPAREPWRIEGPDLDLTFVPQGARRQNVELGVISSRFVQPFGRFHGRLTVAGQDLAVADAFGVVEDHLARW